MFKRILMTSVLAFCMAGMAVAQSMSDAQVLDYAKSGLASGKSQKQLATELAAKGVTRAQAERVKRMYDAESAQKATATAGTGVDQLVTRTNPEDDNVGRQIGANQTSEGAGKRVFGRDIFRTRQLSFEPSANLATPQNYRLGPGDEVIIEIWGASQNTLRLHISPEGCINIPDLGPVSLNGMSVQEANSYLKKELSKIYASIYSTDQDAAATDVKLTLGQIRTIQINIMGEVANPGTYAVSSFSTLFHALYRAGGVSQLGSLRNIKLVRDGRTAAIVDVYDYLMKGASNDDIRLQEGDVVLVSPFEQLVEVQGKVKRPMYYEMKKGESLATLLTYAGGLTNDAYARSLTIERMTGRELKICTVDQSDFPSFKVQDGDIVTIGETLKRYENRVEVRGAVYRPGAYELGNRVNTVRALIEKADGLMDDAFLNRAVLHRERPDRTLEVVALDLSALMAGAAADVPLQKNDVLYIPSRHDLQDLGTITIHGEVLRPGTLDFADNMTLEDAVIQTGGLRESASLVRVDVVRRIKDKKSNKTKKELADMYTFSLKEGFVVDGQAGFVLEPYDEIYVRRSPGYAPQMNVSISGEVEFGGTYALTEREERLSDLVKKAGGLNDFAYAKGARLLRRINDEERRRMQNVLDIARASASTKDSIAIAKLNFGDTYYVGIDLEEAMKNPGGSADVVLREGDALIIPQMDNTVRVSGCVLYPNTVTYQDKKHVKYYINEAGGYGERARKRSVFVIYMNGHVKKAKKMSASVVQPGCEVIVPEKGKKQWSLANTLAVATTTASLATMVATIANILK